MLRKFLLGGLASLAVFATVATAPASASPVFVSALSNTPTLIGTLTGGQSYTVTASGTAFLCSTCDGGHPLVFYANGVPVTVPTGVYAPIGTAGLDYDPSAPGTSHYGIGGAGKLLGALLGTFKATPTGPSDFFTIGLNTSITATTNETLYAVVNDTGYPDNSSGYSVTVAVPEPATLTLLGAGALVICVATRRRNNHNLLVQL